MMVVKHSEQKQTECKAGAGLNLLLRWFPVCRRSRFKPAPASTPLHGFSLVELSVVMTIIGVMLGGALTLAINQTTADRIETTEEHMDAIEQALGLFLIQNQRLPCPADGTLPIDNANFGREKVNADPNNVGAADDDTTANTCASNFNDTTGTDPDVIWSGAIPTKTLGLADEYMEDGWGRRMTYAVDKRFTNNLQHTNTDCASGGDEECFTFQDADATESIRILSTSSGTTISDLAAAVIVSHGENGHGAFLRHGSATRLDTGSTDTDELENADLTNKTFIQKSTTTTFDDITRYYLKWQLVSLATGITDGTLCSAAKDVHDTTPADATCPGATNTTTCTNLAEKIFDLCLSQ